MTSYADFLHGKSQLAGGDGFDPVWIPDFLFDFQRQLVEWAIRRGKAAIFADCGLGKGPMQLVFAENVIRKTGGKFLIVAPLAVAQQFVREGAKFGIDIKLSRDGSAHRLTVTNYECLHKFDATDFIGAAADESSAIKAFDGRRRKQVVRFFSKLQYRLLCTATPSPNDFIELGTQSECLGIMTQSDMLGFFFRETKDMRHSPFRDDDIHGRIKWWFKPHSEQPFWRWISSWARAVRKPSDIGFSDDGFVLPPLTYESHVLNIPFVPKGELYHRPAITLNEQRDERKRTVNERCEKAAELLNHAEPGIGWVHYNEEGTTLASLIPDCVEVAGRHNDDFKEGAMTDFALGNVRVLVTKPKIGCWGLNLQHCGNMTFFPTFSFEQFYQGIRRCWRFGRDGPVKVNIVSAEGESRVMDGLTEKQQQSEKMFTSLVRYMNDAMAMMSEDGHTQTVILPPWLQVEVASCR